MSIHPVAERDSRGLELHERRLLQEIARTGSWTQAADNLGLTRRNVKMLFHKPAFKEEYDALFSIEETQATRRELEMLSSDIADLYESAKTAEMEKLVPVECPKCQTKWRITVTVMNWTAKLRAAETLLKIAGILKDTKNVKIEGRVNFVLMTVAEQIALMRLKSGFPVPPHMYQRLKAMGALDDLDTDDLPSPILLEEGKDDPDNSHTEYEHSGDSL